MANRQELYPGLLDKESFGKKKVRIASQMEREQEVQDETEVTSHDKM